VTAIYGERIATDLTSNPLHHELTHTPGISLTTGRLHDRTRNRASRLDLAASNLLGNIGLSRQGLLGHGIGLDIHEEPYFSQTSKEVIKTGMVLTDEPGIYIEGKYGVRIEDDILITDNGCELLTLAPKELIVI